MYSADELDDLEHQRGRAGRVGSTLGVFLDTNRAKRKLFFWSVAVVLVNLLGLVVSVVDPVLLLSQLMILSVAVLMVTAVLVNATLPERVPWLTWTVYSLVALYAIGQVTVILAARLLTDAGVDGFFLFQVGIRLFIAVYIVRCIRQVEATKTA